MDVELFVVVISGLVQLVAEPVREFQSPFFWAKMTLLAVVVILSALFSSSVRANAQRWDTALTVPAGARAFALVSSVLWIGIIVFGRLISYTWILRTQ